MIGLGSKRSRGSRGGMGCVINPTKLCYNI